MGEIERIYGYIIKNKLQYIEKRAKNSQPVLHVYIFSRIDFCKTGSSPGVLFIGILSMYFIDALQ
jgi:hypothetical protein